MNFEHFTTKKAFPPENIKTGARREFLTTKIASKSRTERSKEIFIKTRRQALTSAQTWWKW